MLKTIAISVFFLATISVLPQERSSQKVEATPPKEPRYFHLDFVIRELDGKRAIASRNYSMTIVANDHAHGFSSIRTGNRVPIPATSKEAQFSYSDIGVNIDSSDAETVGSELALNLTTEISSLTDAPASASMPPLLRSTRWRSTALVVLAKPTTVFTAEDDKTNHTLEMEVTATPLH